MLRQLTRYVQYSAHVCISASLSTFPSKAEVLPPTPHVCLSLSVRTIRSWIRQENSLSKTGIFTKSPPPVNPQSLLVPHHEHQGIPTSCYIAALCMALVASSNPIQTHADLRPGPVLGRARPLRRCPRRQGAAGAARSQQARPHPGPPHRGHSGPRRGHRGRGGRRCHRGWDGRRRQATHPPGTGKV